MFVIFNMFDRCGGNNRSSFSSLLTHRHPILNHPERPNPPKPQTQIQGIGTFFALPKHQRCFSVRMKRRPDATAGVEWQSSCSAKRCRTLKSSLACTTTSSPEVETQNRRPSIQIGDPK